MAGVFFQRLEQHRVYLWRNLSWVQATGRGRLHIEVLVASVPPKRHPPGEQPEGNHPHCVLVGGRLHIPQNLLRGHVLRRTGRVPLHGHGGGCVLTGNAEVAQHSVVYAAQKNVARLHIAVDNVIFVGIVQRAAHLQQNRHPLPECQLPLLLREVTAQAAQRNVLQREVGPPLIVTSAVFNNDVRVVEIPQNLPLLHEALNNVVALNEGCLQNLKRNVDHALAVVCPVNNGHAARPDPFFNGKVVNRLADEWIAWGVHEPASQGDVCNG